MLRAADKNGEVRVPVAAVQAIEKGIVRINHLVGDLLDYARIEIGQLKLELKPVDVRAVTAEIVERSRSEISGHSLLLESEGQPPAVELDVLRFDQILGNLIDNAAKYSAPGTPIRVRVRARENGVELAVIDQGKGIAPAELPYLFDRFYRSRVGTQGRAGLGLGLYITKGLVEAQKGRVSVDSELGRGSVFRVWFPEMSRLEGR